ncbi:DUF4158 domain-containing protein, partial [Salmonella enterica subsp. enterica]|nr:DUF4158 domain-containing protein [Salmonella enterica subsp. enterica]MDG0243289.1 DUF4158 domain-containing protein [Salmonella enterica subsp. enterica]
MPAFEWVHVQLHQQKGMISLSPPTICNSADMNHIPSGVRHFTARQLGIRDITVLAEYGQRENTRREHAAL